MNAATIHALSTIQLDPKDKPNISYTKARFAIENICKNREDIRAAKIAMIEHLKGTINHPSTTQQARGATKSVVFPDNSRAKF